MAEVLYGSAAKQCLETRLFYDLRLSADANQVSTAQSAALTGVLQDFTRVNLGHSFGLSQIRHIIAALARKANVIHHNDHSAEQEELAETYDKQAGHSTRTSDMVYARCGDDHNRIGDFFRKWSLIYHDCILGLKETRLMDETVYSILRVSAGPVPGHSGSDDYRQLCQENKKLQVAVDGLREDMAALLNMLKVPGAVEAFQIPSMQ